MKKRIFLGFEISEKLTELILSWRKKKIFPDFVRFIAPENLHMTLAPPWYESDIGKVKSLLSEALLEQGFYPFKVEFTTVKVFPRLLWLEGKKSVQLEVLRDKLLEKLNMEKEKRDFIPHITLARCIKGRGKVDNFSCLESSLVFVEKFSEIVIFESKLSRNGASYKVITKFKL